LVALATPMAAQLASSKSMTKKRDTRFEAIVSPIQY
jgi:hypothetical protein